MNESLLTRISELAGISKQSIVAIYPYGSRVYGTATVMSDYDYIVVYSGDTAVDGQQFDSVDKTISVHTYTVESWQHHLDAHRIFAIECHSMTPAYQSDKFMEHPFTFTLDLPTLRKEISSKSSNSWVKCKKKLTVETGEEYIGIKSLFHSFRIPMFGIQIAKHGKVVDFTEANPIWEQLAQLDFTSITWYELNATYKKSHNALMTKFRTHAEKL